MVSHRFFFNAKCTVAEKTLEPFMYYVSGYSLQSYCYLTIIPILNQTEPKNLKNVPSSTHATEIYSTSIAICIRNVTEITEIHTSVHLSLNKDR